MAEATVPEIKTDVCGPDINTTDIDTVLEGLASSCFSLQWERNRYRFGLAANLNQVLVSHRGGVKPNGIDERIRKQSELLFAKNSLDGTKHIDRRFFPTRSNDMPGALRPTRIIHALIEA